MSKKLEKGTVALAYIKAVVDFFLGLFTKNKKNENPEPEK